MKRLILAISFVAGVFIFQGCATDAYVTTQPAYVEVVRPPQPAADYIWIDGDWYWRGGHYEHRPGYWSALRQGRVYAPGYWRQGDRGYHWMRGHWR